MYNRLDKKNEDVIADGVILASPVGHLTPALTSGTLLHASKSSGPAALCMAKHKYLKYYYSRYEIQYKCLMPVFLPRTN
jgi:hypothetical protein